MVATRSSTKRAEMTDQQAATSAATGEPSQQPTMAASLSENMAELLAGQQAQQLKLAAEQDTRLQAGLAKMVVKWAEQTASFGKDTIDVRLKRLERGESAQIAPSESSDIGESSDPKAVIVPAEKGGIRQLPPSMTAKRTGRTIACSARSWLSSTSGIRFEKAAFLATSLEGSATNILCGIPADRRQDYAVLVAALDMRFGVVSYPT